MIAFVFVLALVQVGLAAPSTVLDAEARAKIAPVLAVLADEQKRQAEAPPPADDTERFLRMYRLDQIGREAMQDVDLSDLPLDQAKAAEGAMWAAQSAVDDANLDALLKMLPPEGWFYKSRYGEGPSQTAFLIIQHSDLEQWRRFVPVLEPLVATGEVDGQQFGLMYDRLAINEQRPQRYGTQMACKDGRWAIDRENLEDPVNADKRRAEMGFRQTLAEYETNFVHYPPCSP